MTNECEMKFTPVNLKKLREKSFGDRHVVMQNRAKKTQECKQRRAK